MNYLVQIQLVIISKI